MTKREYLWQRDGGICVYCQQDIAAHVEHVLPRQYGGKSTVDNLVMSCVSCNMQKVRLNEAMMVKAFVYLSRVEPLAGGRQSGLNNITLEETAVDPLEVLASAIKYVDDNDAFELIEELRTIIGLEEAGHQAQATHRLNQLCASLE